MGPICFLCACLWDDPAEADGRGDGVDPDRIVRTLTGVVNGYLHI